MNFKVGDKIKIKPYDKIIELNKKKEELFDISWNDLFKDLENTKHNIKRIEKNREYQNIYIFNLDDYEKIKGIRKCSIFFYDYEVIPISFIKLKDELFKL